MSNLQNLKQYSPVLLRISLSFVFLWFGLNQIFNPSGFLGYLPNFILITGYGKTVLLINGLFEIIFGALLIIGLFTRVASLLLALHMIGIIYGLGYNDIAIRDFGIMLATWSVFLHGPDKWCLYVKRKPNKFLNLKKK